MGPAAARLGSPVDLCWHAGMQFAEVAATSAQVASTRARTLKRDALAELLSRVSPSEVPAIVGFLTGQLRQGRTGVGWQTLTAAEDAAASPPASPTLRVADVDQMFSVFSALGGAGSATERRRLLIEVLDAATDDERELLRSLISGELRQGASVGVMAEAVAAAASVPVSAVRRATMFGGRLDDVAAAAMTGGRSALERISLVVGRPLQPMLASTSPSASAAVEELGAASVEWKLDGIRIQVHRRGDEVRVWSRNLNDITEQVPSVRDVVAALPLDQVVLDGEALVVDEVGRPAAFQDTAAGRGVDAASRLRPYFFDLLHLDGRDFVDEPLHVRRSALERIAMPWVVPSECTESTEAAEMVLRRALAAGHEGVVVKSNSSSYAAGRRGKAWRKVKPVHTLDLVVLAVEWGHGRRSGLLSNLHLGARDGAGGDDDLDGDRFVMVGKTFKGMTDGLLRWQTERFLELAIADEEAGERSDDPDLGAGVVAVRPVQVVEIAVDGVQRSTRYRSGVALRFARVLRYREDKGPAEVDTIDSVRALGSR